MYITKEWLLRLENDTLVNLIFVYVAGSAAGIIRSTRSGRTSGADHRTVSAETCAAAAVGTAFVVGGTGRVRSLHAVRRAVQRIQHTGRRAALHAARPASRRRRLLTAPPHHPPHRPTGLSYEVTLFLPWRQFVRIVIPVAQGIVLLLKSILFLVDLFSLA